MKTAARRASEMKTTVFSARGFGVVTPGCASSLRRARRRLAMRQLWPHHNLDAPVALVAEERIHLRRVVEPRAMGDDERRIDLVALDALVKCSRVVVDVGLPHAQRQSVRERGAEWDLI